MIEVQYKIPPTLPQSSPLYRCVEEYIYSTEPPPFLDNFRNIFERKFHYATQPSGSLLIIQHTSHVGKFCDYGQLGRVTFTGISTIGLFDVGLFGKGHLNEESPMFWFLHSKVPVQKITNYGVVVGAGNPSIREGTVKELSHTDGLLYLQDAGGLTTVVLQSEAYGYETY